MPTSQRRAFVHGEWSQSHVLFLLLQRDSLARFAEWRTMSQFFSDQFCESESEEEVETLWLGLVQFMPVRQRAVLAVREIDDCYFSAFRALASGHGHCTGCL